MVFLFIANLVNVNLVILVNPTGFLGPGYNNLDIKSLVSGCHDETKEPYRLTNLGIP